MARISRRGLPRHAEQQVQRWYCLARRCLSFPFRDRLRRFRSIDRFGATTKWSRRVQHGQEGRRQPSGRSGYRLGHGGRVPSRTSSSSGSTSPKTSIWTSRIWPTSPTTKTFRRILLWLPIPTSLLLSLTFKKNATTFREDYIQIQYNLPPSS